MRILKEVEAVGYLGRLNRTLQAGLDEVIGEGKYQHSLSCFLPFSCYLSMLQVEVSYFQRLLRAKETKGLAALAISSSGFPELPSLQVDIQKAYDELGLIQSRIGDDVFPLLRHLDTSGDLTAFDLGVENVVSGYREDEAHINLLRRLQSNVQERQTVTLGHIDRGISNKLNFLCTYQEKPGLLFYGARYTTEKMDYFARTEGFLKYIDSSISPLLIHYGISGSVYYKSRKVSFLKTCPDRKDVIKVLEPLNPAFRERFLAMDFTAMTEGSFERFIQSAAKMGSLLEQIKGAEETTLVPMQEERRVQKRWWLLGR